MLPEFANWAHEEPELPTAEVVELMTALKSQRGKGDTLLVVRPSGHRDVALAPEYFREAAAAAAANDDSYGPGAGRSGRGQAAAVPGRNAVVDPFDPGNGPLAAAL